jgi:hypothetical protein
MSDRATIERLVLAEVALANDWVPAKTIRWRLGLTYYEVTTAFRDLMRAGDLDWNGLHDPGSGLYRLPLRAVCVRQRIDVAS